MKPNVFIHADNSVSAPLCPAGNTIVYSWFGKHALRDDRLEYCGDDKCTCNNLSPIDRKGTPAEKEKFYRKVAVQV